MEKLKIYVTERIANILEKDAEGFEFFKKDGRTLNRNALLTNLIVNYHAGFTARQTGLLKFMKGEIASRADMDGEPLDALCLNLCERLNEKSFAPDGEKFDKLISVKPTKESQPVIDYIERYCLAGRSLSEYFRSMFASYASLPQDGRELIIFKRQYEAVTEAIKKKKRVFITTRRNPDRKIDCAPFGVVTSKEELHCYVLTAGRRCSTLRLSRIVSVTMLSDDAHFTDGQKETFEKMKAYGPQFTYGQDEGETLVKLTANGAEMFKRMYVHRPVPVRVEGDGYYFECSHSQIIKYFVRFGADAEIIYPQSVRTAVCNFHRKAYEKYLHGVSPEAEAMEEAER